MKSFLAFVRGLWQRFDAPSRHEFSNNFLIITFNVQMIWLYFAMPGKLPWYTAVQVALSIFFAWRLTNRVGYLPAIGAFLISVSGVLAVIFCFASVYENLGIVSSDTHAVTHDPIICLYFSMVTITTLGYGDFIPSPSARLFAGSEAIAGLFLVAALIAILAKVFTRFFGSSTDATIQ
jgi:hypothetical protein